MQVFKIYNEKLDSKINFRRLIFRTAANTGIQLLLKFKIVFLIIIVLNYY